MNLKISKYLSLFLLLTLVSFIDIKAEGGDKDNTGSLRKVTGEPSYYKININNISTWIKNDGESDINPNGNSGFVFPKGSNKAAIFQSGFLWGGRVDGQVRVGGSVYRQGIVPGKILNSGVAWADLIAEDPDAAHVRNYRVRPDINPNNPGVGDLSSEVGDGEGTEAEIRATYEKDWNEWPAADGAPYSDVDGNGSYDPAVDIPGFPGADQTIWFVANDTDEDQSRFMYGSDPMGIEMQATIWAYNRTGALGNMIFRSYKIINKSNTTFTDMYVSMWNDPDLGDASDDFVGCDTTLSMTFVYNANANDATYNQNPASAGFDFFQGPVVDSPGDSAITLGRRVYDKVNLPMTAHYFFINSDPIYTDPAQGVYATGTLQFYNLLQGRVGSSGEVFPVPAEAGGGNTVFALAGDPTTGQGWVDGMQHVPGDRRAGMASGPFNMAPGDTQEVVVAEIAAGGVPPIDRLTAVSLLKFYDQQAQIVYDNFFVVPAPPQAPQITVTPLDKSVVISWGNNPDAFGATENFEGSGYAFQGYNVYQLPSRDATLEQARRIATYDLVDGIGKITSLEFDAQSGVVGETVTQFGTDSDIKRFITITADAFKSNLPLSNGSRYYFAVTAYAFNGEQGTALNVVENPISIVEVIPQSTSPGTRIEGTAGDILDVTHTSGISDGIITPVIIDPGKTTGHQYRITFDVIDEETVWNLTDVTANQIKLSGQTNQSGNDDYTFVDGIQVKVAGPPPGVKGEPDGWDIPQGTRRFTWAGGDFGFEGFNHAIGWASPHYIFGPAPTEVVPAATLKNVLLILGSVPDTTTFLNPVINPDNPPADPNYSFAYRYGRGFTNAAARPEFAPYIVNTENTGGYSFQDFKKSVPLSAWDVEDPANPIRLAVGFLENNGVNALLDGRYFPGDNATYDNVAASGPREWLFIYDAPYSETPNPAYTTDIINDPIPVMYWLTVNRRGSAPFSPAETGEDHFAIFPNKINTPQDVFEFTAPSVTSSTELAKEDVEHINVFPNPYYGVNSQELNKYQRFVTFNHLPEKATIRIFNLAGQLVRTIEKTTPGQFERWDLLTDSGLPVASGLYVVYVDMPDLGQVKILKAAIIQEQQVLDRF